MSPSGDAETPTPPSEREVRETPWRAGSGADPKRPPANPRGPRGVAHRKEEEHPEDHEPIPVRLHLPEGRRDCPHREGRRYRRHHEVVHALGALPEGRERRPYPEGRPVRAEQSGSRDGPEVGTRQRPRSLRELRDGQG